PAQPAVHDAQPGDRHQLAGRPGGDRGHGGDRHGARAVAEGGGRRAGRAGAQRRGHLSARSSSALASTSEGPYQVSSRPLTGTQRRPGNDSGPSVSLKAYGSSGSTTRSGRAAASSVTGILG